MNKTFKLCFSLATVIALSLGQSTYGRSLPMTESQIRAQGEVSAAVTKKPCVASHNIGKVSLAVTNYGTYGTGFVQGTPFDCFTGANVPSCEFPKGSGVDYLFAGAFWIGAIVGHDTLVSMGVDGWQNCREMDPEESPLGDMQKKSIIDPSSPAYIGARSEQDYISVYTDRYTTGEVGRCTGANDPVNGLGPTPLNLEITERSYAWSYSYAQDFVLFDYTIQNIGTDNLTNMYIGIYNDGDVGRVSDQNRSADDVTGFKQDVPTPLAFNGGCSNWRDTINLAWLADNDGNWSEQPPATGVSSMRIVRTPIDSMQVSYNWWVSNGNPNLDFGPQRVATFRDLGTGGRGTPEGERNKYAFLKNREFDYDQAFTCDSSFAQGWEPFNNPAQCYAISKGYDTRFLLSFGPFNVRPGDELPVSFAFVMGEGFHPAAKKDNGKYLTDPTQFNAKLWYSNLDFTNLSLNAIWAGWIYDNPGFSSTGTGFKGNYRIACNNPTDTLYYTGDGVPDFRGAAPPPAPDLWVYPEDRQLRVRWNGARSETTVGVFSKVRDFEGYRVYLSLDERAASFSQIESYDLLDFNKLVFDTNAPGGAAYEQFSIPFKLDSLQKLYAPKIDSAGVLIPDPAWDPLHYTAANPFHPAGFPDSSFYFTAQDYNQSRFGIDTRITKIYPDAPKPTVLDSNAIPVDQRPLYLTADGHFKYYEYQLIIDNLLPTIPYYVNVTAFSFGSPASGLGSLESSPTVGYKTAYAAASNEAGTTKSKQVYVFPNPYRADGGYLANGYEGNDPLSRNQPTDRQHRIRFANVPSECTINIFTLDGDLVRSIVHPDPLSPCKEDPNVSCWDLITRNTQLAVSGIYYWTVDDHKGNVQIGKLVLIM